MLLLMHHKISKEMRNLNAQDIVQVNLLKKTPTSILEISNVTLNVMTWQSNISTIFTQLK